MTAGLVVSIIGTGIVEGGSDGVVVADLFPVLWIAIFATASQGISFAAPLIARIAGRFDPASMLVASDVVESALSFAAVGALFVIPDSAPAVLAVYLLLSTVFPAITDVVEELYAQQLAQLDADEALTFNAAIYSILGFVGLVLAMPFGVLLAADHMPMLILLDAAFSAVGALLRLVSARTVVTTAVLSQDLEDFGVVGARMPFRHFLRDLVASGPVSPLLAAVVKAGATLGGIFLYLWLASAMPVSPSAGLAIVLVVFGVGATVGPWLAPLLRTALSLSASLIVAHVFGACLIAIALCVILLVPREAAWPVLLAYVFLIALFSRVRTVLTTTVRQQHFRGSRFASMMGWAFSLTALGELTGSWLGAALRADLSPAWALAVYLAAVIVALVVIARFDLDAYIARSRSAEGGQVVGS